MGVILKIFASVLIILGVALLVVLALLIFPYSKGIKDFHTLGELYDPIAVDLSKREIITQETKSILAKEDEENAQKIPRVIFQTNATNEIGEGLFLALENVKKFNPEYTHLYFNDNECSKFIEENFDKRTFRAYSSIVPGAYRSDFFRACYLYKNGGVYMDTGITCVKPLRELIHENDVFISPEDNGTNTFTSDDEAVPKAECITCIMHLLHLFPNIPL